MANTWLDIWMGIWDNTWGALVDSPFETGDSSFYNTLVEIYDDSAPDVLLDILHARMSPSALNELRAHGAGSFIVSASDPKVLANPSLLEYRKIVKIRMNGVVVGGFIIQTKKTVMIGSGEESEESWAVSGEGVRSASRDAAVYPSKGLKATSADTRYFNFATEQGLWYDPSEWSAAVPSWGYQQYMNYWGTGPREWPDASNAVWIWDRNPGLGDNTVPPGYIYLRKEFNVPTSAAHAFFIAADDQAEVYIDGELLLTTALNGWSETNRIDVDLEAGNHVIGIKAYNSHVTIGPAGVLAAMFKFGDPLVPTSASLLFVSDASWKVRGYPSLEPGWSVGDVLLTLLDEAKARGVRFAEKWTPTFSADLDSSGQSWGEPIPWAFTVGATYENVIESMEEMGCDIWVDPDSLDVYAWKKRGTDRSTEATVNAIVFQAGHNLLSAEETGQAEIANTLLLHATDGWTEEESDQTASFTKYGRVESQLSTQLSSSGAAPLVDEVFRLKSLPERSGTFQIIPVEGMIPFVDYNVGDTVSAPTDVPGVLESRRIMSISFTEDDATGKPILEVEFDSIFKDRQAELEKWVSRISNSSAIGGGFSNSSSLPPTSVQAPAGPALGTIPDAPTGLLVSSVGEFGADGSAAASFGLTWNAVSTGVGFGQVEVTQYEVWGRPTDQPEAQFMAITFDAFAHMSGFRSGESWTFKVRAVSRTGGPGPFSDEVTLVAANPVVALGAPSTPTLSSGVGTVTVRWNGLIEGSPAPGYVRFVRVERSPVGAGTWTSIGTIINGQIVDSSAVVGNTYDYRLTAVDPFGNPGTPSAIASIMVTGIQSGDIAGGLASQNLIANGSFENDLSNWVIKSIHPGGASSATILTSGSLAGAKYLRLIRGTETAGTEQPLQVAQAEASYIPISSVGNNGYFLSAKVAADATYAETFTLSAFWYLADRVTPASTESSSAVDLVTVGTTAQYVAGKVIPPADARFMRVAVINSAENSLIYVDDVVAREVINGAQVGQDAITSVHISAGSITANALQTGAVTSDSIAAGAILADKIAAGAVTTNHIAAEVGASLDISSNASVNIIVNRQDTMEGDLVDTQTAVTDLQTYYNFTAEGAIIGQTDSAFKLFLKNDRIEILENGAVVSYWDSGQMNVDRFVGEEVVLSNHKFEKYGTGTVVRKL